MTAMQGNELKSLRRLAGMTQAALAEKIGMARETIGAMERDQAPIELRTELAIRFVTMSGQAANRPLDVLASHAADLAQSVLDGDPLDDDDVAQCQSLMTEWLDRRGTVVGYYLLMALNSAIGYLNHASPNAREGGEREVRQFAAAWDGLRSSLIVAE